ncbi:MAG TPA: hypothetical protein VEY33_11780 [Gemmatimonadota bacterium]|nr:hypothetical protein [Gemmatimonadota bacterium]
MKQRTWIWMTARDPLYRVTVCEAGQAAKLCVAKTAQVDVLDFP